MKRFYEMSRWTLELLGDLGNTAVAILIFGELLRIWDLL